MKPFNKNRSLITPQQVYPATLRQSSKAVKLATMVHESVEDLLVRKAGEIGRVLTAREEEYLRLQVERT